ncbi:flagellar basal body-associated FliL family protein, partial [bacterium]
MSEAAAAAPKKKKGKLPIIIALVAILGGGGFFMTKKKGPEKAAHTVELAAAETPIPDEFLVNMSDGRTYVRTKIAVILRKDYKPEDWEKHAIEVADAVNMALKTTDPKRTTSEADMKALKRKIAASINRALGPGEEHGPEGGEATEGKTTVVDLDKKKEKKE